MWLERWCLRLIGFKDIPRVYESLSLLKVASGNPAKMQIGILEILSSQNRDSKQMLFKFCVEDRNDPLLREMFREALVERLVWITAGQQELVNPNLKSTNMEIDLLVRAAKRRCSMIFRLQTVFCVLVTLVMLCTALAAVIYVVVYSKTTWGVALGGVGLGQFLLLIWRPLRMLQKVNADTTRIQLSIHHYREAFAAVESLPNFEERQKKKKQLLKEFVAALT